MYNHQYNFICRPNADGGLFVTNLETGNTQKILKNNSKECKTGGVTVNKEGTIIFSGLENGTLNSADNEGMSVRKLLGTSEKSQGWSFRKCFITFSWEYLLPGKQHYHYQQRENVFDIKYSCSALVSSEPAVTFAGI